MVKIILDTITLHINPTFIEIETRNGKNIIDIFKLCGWRIIPNYGISLVYQIKGYIDKFDILCDNETSLEIAQVLNYTTELVKLTISEENL